MNAGALSAWVYKVFLCFSSAFRSKFQNSRTCSWKWTP